MNLNEINIRDPFILLHEGKYYLYGTRSYSCWGKADGFDGYVSNNLTDWDGPFEIFKRPEGFWADQNYWAPECISYRDKFYLITTLGTEGRKGIQILESDHPLGAFCPISDEPITPRDWNCIDGTIYFDRENKAYLIFSHSFEDVPDGDMCLVELSEDLTQTQSEIAVLFSAKDASWANPVPFAKAEFGISGEVYFTDGPCVYPFENGKLAIIWSSWGENGYVVGVSISDSGEIHGPWRHVNTPIYPENGGHGMIFTSIEGEKFYVLHYPNDLLKEHPALFYLMEEQDTLILKEVK